MSKQVLFNEVFKHLWKQNKSAMDNNNGECGDVCMYKSMDGLKCAVGCLITYENYDSNMEANNVGELVVLHKVELSLNRRVGDEELLMLKDLQDVHDSLRHFNEEPSTWREKYLTQMYQIANNYGLTLPVLERA